MKEKNVHSGHRKRLRNMILKGDVDSLQDYQLLEFLLTYTIPRKDTNVLAHNLISHFGTLSGVLDAKPEFLMKIDGVGENTAIFLSTLPKIFSLYKIRKEDKKFCFKNSLQTLSYCIKILENKPYEEIYLVMADEKYNLINYACVAKGTTNRAYATIRDITEIALKNNSSFVLLTHNHPQSDPEPSFKDDSFTKNIVMSMTLNGIGVLDHLIVGKDASYYSYNEQGRIEQFKSTVLNGDLL